MKNLILLIYTTPFWLELFIDWKLIQKGRKDIPWSARAVAIMFISVIPFLPPLQAIAIALAPYCFFDLALNKLRDKDWFYQGENQKWWDRAIKWLTGKGGISNGWVLTGRVIAFIGFVILGLKHLL